MEISAYQRWFAEYDRQRGLDLIEPSQVTVHLMEEIGEIARAILTLEGYRDPGQRQEAIRHLAEEIGDALVFLTKIAQHYNIDLETVVQNVVCKAESRWPVAEALQEMERYIRHQQAVCVGRATAWKQRFATTKQDEHHEETPHA